MKQKNKDQVSILVRKAQQGDETSMASLIELFQRDLLRFCIYLSGSEVIGQDLCQDTFIRALENIRSLKEPERFKSWLFQTAKNHFLNFLKSPRNAPAEELDDHNAGQEDSSADISLAVKSALSKLEADDRLVILLIDLQENSYEEAARVLGISEAAVRSKLHRARKSFMEYFNQT